VLTLLYRYKLVSRIFLHMMMDLEGENEAVEIAEDETVDDELEFERSGIANADKIRGGRIVEGTRKSYQRVFRYITNYFKKRFHQQ